MRELPDWIHDGAIVCIEGGTTATTALVDKLAAARVPVAAIWFQDWTGQDPTDAGIQVWWNWALDTTLFHDWTGLRDTIAARLGARVMLT